MPLPSWEGVKKVLDETGRKEPGILLGNGASQAIWNKFRYGSLFEVACDPTEPNHLSRHDISLFDRMKTTNFEAVLSALATSRQVCELLELPTERILESYQSIRLALIQAIQKVHVPFSNVTEGIKYAICEELKTYSWVYTTNYDLLPYWSYMHDKDRFKDFMWHGGFDLGNSELFGAYATKVLFLHGALQIYKDLKGSTIKMEGEEHRGLLDKFDTDGDLVPLFISEGTWQEKRSAIQRSDYLSFAFRKFADHIGNLVIFGHSLTPAFDQHIIDAIVRMRQRDYREQDFDRRLAIAIYPKQSDEAIREEKTRFRQMFNNYNNILFFDSTTHPLGMESMAAG